MSLKAIATLVDCTSKSLIKLTPGVIQNDFVSIPYKTNLSEHNTFTTVLFQAISKRACSV